MVWFTVRLRRYALGLIIVLVLLPLPGRTAEAHAYSAGYTTLDIDPSTTTITFTLDLLSVMELTGGDTDKNGRIDEGELAALQDHFLALARKNLKFTVNNEPVEWISVEGPGVNRKADGEKAVLKISLPGVPAGSAAALTDTFYQGADGTSYVNLLTIHHDGRTSSEALSGQYRTWSMASSSQGNPDDKGEAAGSPERLEGWVSFFKLGMTHILTGYDHLLFLFSLLIAKQKFKQYAAMITAFTVAHSITLTLTVLGIIDIPSRWVEPAIALSICFVAVDNMVRREVSRRWILTFAFGLIHGMGFADILKDMDLPAGRLAAALVSFNLGIEAVQVALVALLLPLLFRLHRWKFSRGAVYAGSTLALLMGGIWLLQRLFFS